MFSSRLAVAFRGVWILLLLCGATDTPAAAGDEMPPVFAIDSLAHAATASRIAATPDERHLVTVSHDKSIRVWAADSGRLVRRLVIPVKRPNDGEMMALALSPDGGQAAVGGYLRAFGKDNALAVVSLHDGKIRQAMPGFTSVIWSLAWSPDGRFLAVGLGDDGPGRGVLIFETEGWTRVFVERAVDGRVASLAFRADNRLAATTHNPPRASSIYLFKPQGGSFVRVASKTFGAKGGLRANWSHDGAAIYVMGHGYYNGDDLTEPPHPAHVDRRSGGKLPMLAVRETPDGRWLFGLSNQRHERTGKLWRWPLPSTGRFEEIDLPDPRALDFVALKNGSVAYVTDTGVVAAIGADLKPLWRNERQLAAIQGRPERLRVSADEQWISLPVDKAGQEQDIAFNLLEARFAPANALKTRWKEPDTGRRGMSVLAWQGTQEPTINEVRFPMKKERERSLSVAVHSAEEAFVFGSSGFYLRKADAAGKVLWSRYLQAEVAAVNLLEKRGLVLAATANGFVHVLRWSDGQPLVSLYLEPGRRQWIAVDPRGRYEAGIGAEDLGGWIVAAGKGRTADFFPLSRFRKDRLMPGLIRGAVTGEPAGSAPGADEQRAAEKAAAVIAPAVQESEAEAGEDVSPAELPVVAMSAGSVAVDRLPPVVDVLSPGFEATVGERQLRIRYQVRSAADAPVISVVARVTSASQATRGLLPKPKAAEGDELVVDLPAEDAEVQVIAENRWGASVPATIRVRWQGRAEAPSVKKKGVLHVLAVGVSQYDNPDYRLGLAAKDAQDFITSIRRQEGGLYESVRLHVLTDSQAAKGAVEQGIAALREQVGPLDTTMVFLAGHGINDTSGEYLYLPRDASLDRLADTGVSFRKIGDLLASLPGRTVMFVDTCHSGNVIDKLRAGAIQNHAAAVNELASVEKNIVVFASSTGGQLSLEDPRWGNGAFTKALLEGFAGKADLLKRGRVTYKQLDAYVADRVDELTEGRQTPVTPVLVTVPDFPLAVVRP